MLQRIKRLRTRANTAAAAAYLAARRYSLPLYLHRRIFRGRSQPGLNVIGYARAETGMGEVPRAVLRALAAHGYPVAQVELAPGSWARAQDDSVQHIAAGCRYDRSLVCVNADQAPDVLRRSGLQCLTRRSLIGFWHWETSNFPTQWLDSFAYFDEVWVSSSFVQKALAAVSPIPVVHVGLPVNALQPSNVTRQDLGLPEDRFLFLFSFDMHSLMQRKNPLGLINAYQHAFGSGCTRTKLVIKVNNLHAFPAEAAQLQAAVASVSGLLIDQYMDRQTLTGLYAQCDAYVSLHRSEGFGLTLAEAMALGKPVIGTAYSGNMDFMTPANSYLVGYQVVEIDQSYGSYHRGDVWAEPDIEHASILMRQVVEQPQEARRKSLQAAADIHRFYNSSVIAQHMVARLERMRY